MFCALSGISLSWKTLVFGRFTSQERTNVHRRTFFLHTPHFSLSKVTALKIVWGKDTSRSSKEPGSDLPPCFSVWVLFCKCGWRHHIPRSGCGPDWCKVKNFFLRASLANNCIDWESWPIFVSLLAKCSLYSNPWTSTKQPDLVLSRKPHLLLRSLCVSCSTSRWAQARYHRSGNRLTSY